MIQAHQKTMQNNIKATNYAKCKADAYKVLHTDGMN